MEDARAGSIAARHVVPLLADGDRMRDVRIDSADGLGYLTHARDEAGVACLARRGKRPASCRRRGAVGPGRPLARPVALRGYCAADAPVSTVRTQPTTPTSVLTLSHPGTELSTMVPVVALAIVTSAPKVSPGP